MGGSETRKQIGLPLEEKVVAKISDNIIRKWLKANFKALWAVMKICINNTLKTSYNFLVEGTFEL